MENAAAASGVSELFKYYPVRPIKDYTLLLRETLTALGGRASDNPVRRSC